MVKNHAFEITRRVLQNTLVELLPGPEVQGEPFWTLMCVEADGETTGSFYANQSVIPLFLDKGQADNFLSLIKQDDLAVRGISLKHLQVLLGFQKHGRVQLGICVPGLECCGNYGVFTSTVEQFEELLKELGFSLDDV
ncbi:hypothetical protein [Desulfoscipio gibsoniae]|uniref:Uncharacterized protein n=1 Tax=Desulfoscipio gibsoniae DSM 7213 TaxID=767817 RepID=R4KHJ6_9FIRM|nr:hypothetical protein [Desulfoscipio gibsoniae]AGL01122.1 hypothetical protein Desgi_1651 [Desulfoscipio gibsoniae DSM 7213]